MRVAIIGAGISGLSIAKKLSEKNNGFVIDVYEAAAKSGGRISSFDWQLKNERVFSCDNGQHFTIGAYTEFIELLDKCDALKYWTRHSFEWRQAKRCLVRATPHALPRLRSPGALWFLLHGTPAPPRFTWEQLCGDHSLDTLVSRARVPSTFHRFVHGIFGILWAIPKK